MFQLADLKRLDPTRIDLTRIDLTKIDLPSFDLPTFDLPKIDLGKIDLPKLQLPKVDRPLDRLAGIARDAAYVGVGAMVVATRSADERRRTATDQVRTQVRRLVDAVA